ncbi:MAG: ATP-binding protein [Deltaproteobacteria bacterium]|nr:ATP-binding protein [Deltaproteobacteria bacterium]
MLISVSSGLFIGLTPETAVFKEIAADALASADLLGLDASILGEAIAGADAALGAQYKKSFSQMQGAFARSEDVLGRQAQFALANVVRGLSNDQWKTVLDKSKKMGAMHGGILSTFDDNLTSARKAIGSKATSVNIAQSQDGKNEKALGSLGAQAAYGDLWAKEALVEIAGGLSPMKQAASIVLRILAHLEKMANAKDRMAFAEMARKILDEEDQHLQKLLQDTRNWHTAGLQMTAFETAFGRVLRALDAKKDEVIGDWKKCEEANRIVHDEIQTPLGHLYKMGDSIVCGKLKPDSPLPEWYFGNADAAFLDGIVKLAARKNIRSIISSVVDVHIDVQVGIPLHMHPKERNGLEMALFELINNGLKYYDPKKEKHWIRVEWNAATNTLIVADNGLGMTNGDGEVVIRGTGYGQDILRKRLEEIGWGLKRQSTSGEGTTFHIRPGLRQKIAWQTVSVGEIDSLSPEQQIGFAEDVFNWVYAQSITLYQQLQSLEKDDLQGWEKTYREFDEKMKKLDEWACLTETSPVVKLYRALWTAIGQVAYAQIDVGIALKKLQEKKIGWDAAKKMLRDPEEIVKRKLQNDGTFYHGSSRGFVELEDTLFAWLDANFSYRLRLSDGWKFVGRAERTPKNVQNFKPASWPPDPENDLWFKSYLKLLGWKMKTDVNENGGVTVRLIAPNSIPKEEIPPLAKKLAEEIRELLLGNERVLRPLLTHEGLRTQKELFDKEFRRLARLFPQSEDRHLNEVMFKIQSGLKQIAAIIVTGMDLGAEEADTGRATLEEALEEIPVYPFPAEEMGVGDTGTLPVDFLFKELATALVELLQFRKPAEIWDAKNKSWFLTYDLSETEKVKHSEIGNPFHDFPWPPKPEKQPALQLVLDLLGWELNIIEETQTLLIEVRQK